MNDAPDYVISISDQQVRKTVAELVERIRALESWAESQHPVVPVRFAAQPQPQYIRCLKCNTDVAAGGMCSDPECWCGLYKGGTSVCD